MSDDLTPKQQTTGPMGTDTDAYFAELRKLAAPKQSGREARLEAALRGIMNWRAVVNARPDAVMSDLDPEGIATAIFSGPIWDAAEEVLNG